MLSADEAKFDRTYKVLFFNIIILRQPIEVTFLKDWKLSVRSEASSFL
jgi:hypothetical protein